jgi:ABC-type phosphate/phosphonate transport system substrate-binding protein
MALTFGLVPHTDDAEMRDALRGVCARLSKEVSVEIAPRLYGTPGALATAAGRGLLDVAWVAPLLLAEPDLSATEPLLSVVRQGGAAYHGVVFVPLGSPIRTVAELVGKRMAWGPRTSASGYVVPRVELARRGFDVAHGFAEESFHPSAAAVAVAVHEGRADAGATYAVYENGDPTRPLMKSGFADFLPGLYARVLVAAGPIPSDVVVCRTGTPADLRALLKDALSRMAREEPSRSYLRIVMNAEDFVPFAPGTMDAIRAIAREARELERRTSMPPSKPPPPSAR